MPWPWRPRVEFTRVPPSNEGGPTKLAPIEGRVIGARRGQRIVLYSQGGANWWVQPLSDHPFTEIEGDWSWKSSIHLGTAYAALLVEDGFHPPVKTLTLPTPGGSVLAVATIRGTPVSVAAPKTLLFSGYEWSARGTSSNRNGAPHDYDPENERIDGDGFLHLKIARGPEGWTCSEVKLNRSLGYGVYHFTVQDTSHQEPSVALSLLTWDDQGTEQNHREMDIELSQWGDPKSKNAGYVIQPYYVPENVLRFELPPGDMVHTLRWEPGKASFESTPVGNGSKTQKEVAGKVFTSGVPTPGTETVRMVFCNVAHTKVPLQQETEVVIERFQYLP